MVTYGRWSLTRSGRYERVDCIQCRYCKQTVHFWDSFPTDVLWGSFVTHSFLPHERLLNTADIYVLACLNKPISGQLLCHDQPITRCDISETAPTNYFSLFQRNIYSMDETPKKVIRSEFFCFLCSCNLGKDQVRVFRKSAVDIARLIKRALGVDVSLYSQVNYLFAQLFST